jgi:hypothetical protein
MLGEGWVRGDGGDGGAACDCRRPCHRLSRSDDVEISQGIRGDIETIV